VKKKSSRYKKNEIKFLDYNFEKKKIQVSGLHPIFSKDQTSAADRSIILSSTGSANSNRNLSIH